ncbi:ZNF91 protein, partial [Machaerirhynchus nigripectus]|nr:ZNF91 protein [Machaerirhynchus nigripectus]
ESPALSWEGIRRFLWSSELAPPEQLPGREKPYKCEQCGRNFTSISRLMWHVLDHAGEPSHRCGECGETFSESSGLLGHLAAH